MNKDTMRQYYLSLVLLLWTNLVLASLGFAAPVQINISMMKDMQDSNCNSNIEPETSIGSAFTLATGTVADSSDEINVEESAGALATETATRRVAHIIFNPGSGGGQGEEEEEALATIIDTLEPDISVVLHKTSKDEDLTKQCQRVVNSVQRGADPSKQSNNDNTSITQPLVVASGGDGTVSAAAHAVLNTGIPFGVIPRGTANAFATALGIPTGDIAAACETLLAGHTRPIDAATCTYGTGKRKTERSMILLSGIGWEANMVKTAQGNFKKILGRLAYIWGGVKETFAPKPFRCKLRFDGGKRTKSVKTHSITVAVTAPGGSISAQGTGEVIPDDGLLDITIQTCDDSSLKSVNAMVHLLKAAVVKEPTNTENILQVRAKDVEIQCRSKQYVVEDGELVKKPVKSMRYSILPKALNVIAPPSLPQN